jgi:hypothetical protein
MKNKSIGSGIKIPLLAVLSFLRNKTENSFEEQKNNYFPFIVSVHVGLAF